MSGLIADLRYTLRVLARSPGFVLVATLSLAIGIGANAAIFGVITSLLRDPLPVEKPEELVVVHWTREGDYNIRQIASGDYRDPVTGSSYRTNFSHPLYRSLREASPDAQVFAFNFLRGLSIAVGDQPPVIGGGLLADGRYFPTLRPGMSLGRGFTEDDDRPGAPLVAVLSHAFWQRAFGGDPAVLGRTMRINGLPAEVIGVTEKGFDGMSRGGFFPVTDVTVPLSAQPQVAARWATDGASLLASDETFWLRVMARVRDRTKLPAVTSSLTAAFRSVQSPVNDAEASPPTLLLAPGARGAAPVGADTGRLLWILMGVVGAVLLIACVNLASLMLARGVARQREMAVRRALGSGRARLVRQTLLEGLVIAAAGTAAGLGLVFFAQGALGNMLTHGLGSSAFGSLAVKPKVDASLLGTSALLCVAATLVFGLLPAIRLSGLDPSSFLKHRVAGGSGPKLNIGRALIALQIGVSVPLVVGAALLLRTVSNLNDVELGFDPRGVVMFQIDPGYTRLPSDQYPALYTQLLERLRALPGVHSATLLENALMSGIVSNTRVTIDSENHRLYMNAVGPDFLETMGMRLLAGRMPGPVDGPDQPAVGALNQTAVQRLFGGASPMGATLNVNGREVQIVGVVSDSRYDRQRAPVYSTLYDAALQRPGWGGHHIVLRVSVPPAQLEPDIRRIVTAVDRDLPVPDIRTQLAQMERTIGRERVFTQLLSVFGAFTLLLACIGLHGVTAYSVTRRTSEIGVRIALGARPAGVLWLVLRQVAVLAVAGLVIGVPAAVIAAPVVGSLLYDVAPTDVIAIVAAAAVMLTVAFAAGAQPALRAARLDPLTALRAE